MEISRVEGIAQIVVLWPAGRGPSPELTEFSTEVPLRLKVVEGVDQCEFLEVEDEEGDFIVFIGKRVARNKRITSTWVIDERVNPVARELAKGLKTAKKDPSRPVTFYSLHWKEVT